MHNYTYRVHFTKRERARFLSHHDVMGYFEKLVRRAQLPVVYSQGFNPRPKLSFHTALSLGIQSEDEIVDIQLSGWTPPDEIKNQFNLCSIKGVVITQVAAILQNTDRITSQFYEIDLSGIQFDSNVITSFMALSSANVTRVSPKRSKTVNIRQFVREIHYTEPPPSLQIGIDVSPDGTAKPTEILDSLGLDSNDLLKNNKIKKTFTMITKLHKKNFRKK